MDRVLHVGRDQSQKTLSVLSVSLVSLFGQRPARWTRPITEASFRPKRKPRFLSWQESYTLDA